MSSISSDQNIFNKDDYWLVVAGKMRIAHERAINDDGSITVDLYRNLIDYRQDRAMERAFTFWP